jgi:DNA-binding transcriptional MerR regulator
MRCRNEHVTGGVDKCGQGMRRSRGERRTVLKDQLTLEDLSAATGMTARNVRAYQTKGLIPPPTRQGRRSVYNTGHLLRLQAIERARARGASLSLIASHLAEGHGLDEDTLVGWAAEPSPPVPARSSAPRAAIDALLAAVESQPDPGTRATVGELIQAGIFQQVGRHIYAGRDLAVALTALHRHGLPLDAVLGVARCALAAALPLAEAVREAVGELDEVARDATGHLGEVVGYVTRHVVTERVAS